MTPLTRNIVLIVVLAAIVGTILFLQSRSATHAPLMGNNNADIPVSVTAAATATTSDSLAANDRIAAKAKQYNRVKELVAPSGFVNIAPFKIADLIGKKVILLDFWTYSCINCERTLPYLTSWDAKYKDDGLVIIGVHTPEFDFEKVLANVQMAVKKWGITYPVVLDNDYGTWGAYENRYWPHEYLIDIDGFIVHDHIGEGGYDETENEIVKLLNERKQVLGQNGTVTVKSGEPGNVDTFIPQMVQTPETYIGSDRVQYLVNLPAQSCLNGSCSYSMGSSTPPNSFELSGKWTLDKEYATLAEGSGSIRIHFSANKVNLVAGADIPVSADLYLDGVKITPAQSGNAVKNGTVTFSAHDLYNLVDLKGNYGDHMLEIRFSKPGVSAFAFTFG